MENNKKEKIIFTCPYCENTGKYDSGNYCKYCGKHIKEHFQLNVHNE
ncbi:MAG: hypothetical protein RR290_00600 [Clostridia bacterium]